MKINMQYCVTKWVIREVAAMNKRVTASDWVGNKITMKQLITWYKAA
jgi:hypothetical protein